MKPVHWVSAGVFSLVISWGAHAANVGMVLDVSGSVSANWQGRKVGLDIATALDPGVRIEVEKGASFSFIFYPTRQQLTTQGPATFVIQEQTVNQTRGTAMASRSLPENRAVAAMGFQSQVVPAALVMKTGMDNPARPNLLEPRNRETVLADRPVFEWSAANGATAFDFSLTYNGTVVHQQRVNGTRLELPQGVSLLSGAEYRWQVVPVGSGEDAASRRFFTTATAAQRELLLSQMPTNQEAVADWVLYGAALGQANAVTESLRVWKHVASRRPTSEKLKTLTH